MLLCSRKRGMQLEFMFEIIQIAHAAEEAHEVTEAAEAGGISVHLAPYVVGHIGGLPITSTLLTSWLAMIVLIVFAYFFSRSLKEVPGKFQALIELIIGGIFDFVADTLENRELARKYFPVLMTIFLFLVVMNWIGLLPGVTSIGYYDDHHHLVPFLYPPATDLNITLAFALVAVAVIEFAGIVALGAVKYGGKFVTFKGKNIGDRLLNFVVGLIELISELARIVSFSFRLFGNIFAGKTLLVVSIFFVPFILPVPIMVYETFVGFIQAAVFAFLTLIFIKLAVAEPH